MRSLFCIQVTNFEIMLLNWEILWFWDALLRRQSLLITPALLLDNWDKTPAVALYINQLKNFLASLGMGYNALLLSKSNLYYLSLSPKYNWKRRFFWITWNWIFLVLFPALKWNWEKVQQSYFIILACHFTISLPSYFAFGFCVTSKLHPFSVSMFFASNNLNCIKFKCPVIIRCVLTTLSR